MRKILSLLVLIALVAGCESIFGSKEADCILSGQITESEDSSGNIKFLGEIENVGEEKACFVKITFTIKDSSGDILDIASAYVTSTHLEPGQVSSFICNTDVQSSDVDSWSYEITWDECG